MVRLALPTRLKSYGSSRNVNGTTSRSASPNGAREGKPTPGLLLRTTVLRARNLAAKDRNGLSDPYVVVTLGEAKSVTHAVNKSLNPEWNVTFDMPISSVDGLLFQCVCWDKDRFGKDYLGEFDIAVEDIFKNGSISSEPTWYPLKSMRKSSKISGDVELQFILVDPSHPDATPEQLLQKIHAIVAVEHAADYEDDELSRYTSLENDHDDEDEEDRRDDDIYDIEKDDEAQDPSKPENVEKKKKRLRMKKRQKKARAYEFTGDSECVGIVFLEVEKIQDLPPEKNVTRTGFDMDPFVVVSLGKKTYRTRVIRHNLNPVFEEKMIFQVMQHEKSYHLNFAVVDRDKLSGNDFVGTANISIEDISSCAPKADPETGLYRLKDPVSDPSLLTPPASKSRFRLPISRSSSASSLNKLARPGLKSRNSSSNLTAQTAPELPVAPTSAPFEPNRLSPVSSPQPTLASNNGEESTPPSPTDKEIDPDLKPYVIRLDLKNKDKWEEKHNTELFIKAKYVPYAALRQQFWRAMLKQYDADESSMISKVEITTMLDTLGSTLKESTIDGFFQRFAGQNADQDPTTLELTFDQAVICLEDQLKRTVPKQSMKERVKAHLPDPRKIGEGSPSDASPEEPRSSAPTPPSNDATTAIPVIVPNPLGAPGEEGEALDKDDLADEKGEEHVVEIRECPICHQPRLNKKSDADIITHIATCASSDWRQVNNLVMAGFVSSSQAQRKWYSKVITKISYGGYKLGANSANILVQDRITGQINEERMSVYVRLGIRLLYKGLKSRDMEMKRIRKLLRSLSLKQGVKFDDPASASQIDSFIAFHQLNMDEVKLPRDQFKTFNEFFYRELKPGARPCSAPDNPKIIVSPADCRSVVFNQIEDATTVWIKGRDFSISRLLGKAYPEEAKNYTNGALGIFRLAPQDYHRFHIPVDGVLSKPKLIEGEYYTVNPMAIRSALDVYGENVRIIVPIDSVEHGRVMMICVGAMMVGSTVITAKAGQKVNRTQELGYFKFGGSTIILLFEPGRMKFDSDLVENASGALETLISVGMSIGHSPEQAAYTPDMKKEHVTREEKDDAKRRIEGSLAPQKDPSTGGLDV